MKTLGLFCDRVSSKVRELNYREFNMDDAILPLQIKYSSINHKDLLLVGGAPHVSRQKSIVPGIDAVGTFEGINYATAGFDLGVQKNGTWAMHCAVSEEHLTEIPSGISLQACAAYGTAGLTAAEVVRQILLLRGSKKKQKILVVGGVRGASLLTVIFLLALDYKVTLVNRNDSFVLRDATNFETWLLSDFLVPRFANFMSTESQYDVAVDFLGSDSVVSCLNSLSEGGVLFSVGNTTGNQVKSISMAPFFLRGIRLQGINLELLDPSTKSYLWGFIFENEYKWSHWMSWSEIPFSGLKDHLSNADKVENTSVRTIIEMES